jgi:ketosteroid isomerase-like protein
MTTHRWSTFVWISVALCSGAAGYQLGISAPARAAESAQVLFEADRAFDRETHARRIDGWVDWFAEDGRMFPDGQNVTQGKAAIRELMSPLLSRPENSLRWEPVGGYISASGELGYTFGHSISRRPNEAGQTADYFGKYVTIWKKQPGGSWKVVLDIGNRRPAP